MGSDVLNRTWRTADGRSLLEAVLCLTSMATAQVLLAEWGATVGDKHAGLY